MHPSTQESCPGHGSLSAVNPFPPSFRFQSSRSQLKKFIMFDQSGGKGRIFLHPAVAQGMFNLPPPSQNLGNKSLGNEENNGGTRNSSGPSDLTEGIAKQLAYRQMVASAFTSLQSVRASRQSDLPASCGSGQGIPNVTPAVSSTRLSGTKRSSGAAASGSLHENSEDLDALMSADDDEDEEVRSTGHSPDELSQDEGYEVELDDGSSKRRKMEGGRAATREELDAVAFVRKTQHETGFERKLKIKKTVKKLRSMIPGGSSLEAALVLDNIIMYVKMLRDRVQQLEATRLQNHNTVSREM